MMCDFFTVPEIIIVVLPIFVFPIMSLGRAFSVHPVLSRAPFPACRGSESGGQALRS